MCMPLLSNVPDSALHLLWAPDFESVISNSLVVLSGRPGDPLYTIAQLQVYFCVQDAMETVTTSAIANKEERNFMCALLFGVEVNDCNLKFKIGSLCIRVP